MNPIRDYLLSLFPIRPDERKRVALMFLYSLCAIGAVLIAGRAISRTLFLSMLPQSLTPFKYILPPVFLMATAAWYAHITPRYKQHELITATSLLMTSGVLLFRALLETPFGSAFWVLAAFYVFIEMAAMLVGVQFWSFASEMFTTREARRLLGSITLGGLLANSVSGAGLTLVSSYVLPQDLLFVVVAGLLGSVYCVRTLEKDRPQNDAGPQATDEFPPLRTVFGEMLSSNLVLTIGGIVIVLGAVATIAEYQLDLSLQRFFSTDGQAMLAFLGRFQFWVGIVGVFVQLFVTNHTLARLGLLAALLILPMAIGVGSVAILASGGMLWAVALTRGSTLSLRYSLNDVALNILFLPISDTLRRQSRTVLDGVVKPPILGLLGLLFLLVMNPDIDLVGVQAGDVVPWTYVVLVLLLVWIALVFVARREYTRALAQTLYRRKLSIGSEGLDLRDETSASILEQNLESGDEARIVYALDLVTGAPSLRWDAAVRPLFAHASPAVQGAALQYAELSRNRSLAAETENLLEAAESDVRASAVRTYCVLLGPEAMVRILPFLEDRSLGVQSAAITGLVRHGGIEGVLQGATSLKAMIDSEDAVVRRAAAGILGELQISSFYQPLLLLIKDNDVHVVRAALAAAGRVQHPALIPTIMAKLGDRSTVRSASGALVSFGPGIEASLAGYLAGGDEWCHADIRRQIPLILGRILTEQSAALLWQHVEDSDDITRSNVITGLRRLTVAGVRSEFSRKTVEALLLDEISLYYREETTWHDLGTAGRGELLADALERDHERRVGVIFDLLYLLYPSSDIQLTKEAFRDGDSRARANAIELLETIVEREIGYLMVPVMENDRERLLEIAENVFGIVRRTYEERLAELAARPDAWLRSCALYQIGLLGLKSLEAEVKAANQCEDPLVRETSLVVGRTMLDPERLFALAKDYAQNDPDPQVRRYAHSLLGDDPQQTTPAGL